MRIARVGDVGRERPVRVYGDKVYFVDSIITDWTRFELETDALKRVANAIVYLANPEQGSTTGTVLAVDCGSHSLHPLSGL